MQRVSGTSGLCEFVLHFSYEGASREPNIEYMKLQSIAQIFSCFLNYNYY